MVDCSAAQLSTHRASERVSQVASRGLEVHSLVPRARVWVLSERSRVVCVATQQRRSMARTAHTTSSERASDFDCTRTHSAAQDRTVLLFYTHRRRPHSIIQTMSLLSWPQLSSSSLLLLFLSLRGSARCSQACLELVSNYTCIAAATIHFHDPPAVFAKVVLTIPRCIHIQRCLPRSASYVPLGSFMK